MQGLVEIQEYQVPNSWMLEIEKILYMANAKLTNETRKQNKIRKKYIDKINSKTSQFCLDFQNLM